jgi:outer membrane protein assembly factor BamE (lipoprotein component of BamABCDE complex)
MDSRRLLVGRLGSTSAVGVVALFSILMLVGCQSPQEHRAAVQSDEGDRLTVGKVQREIQVGMSGGEVAQVLGSPNIVSTDELRQEVWIYDKIATDQVYSHSSGGISTLVLGGALVGDGLVGGAAAPYYRSGAGAASTSQRTLTVVIKFDRDKRVRDFAYHTSRF